MKKAAFLAALFAAAVMPIAASAQSEAAPEQANPKAKVYFTSDISPESLVKMYKVLGKESTGRVAVKISTGESEESNQLSPELIEPLVKLVDGTLVECNTAYRGSRYTTESHRQQIAQRGYDRIATVDIMDEEGDMDIPVADTTYIKFDRVGKHLANYDCMINLAHFKGHAMGGFGGVLKNASIGVASRSGKTIIHTAGAYDTTDKVFEQPYGQDAFLESMAAAAQGVHNYFGGKVLYINVMNNLSVDCDCNGHPAAPQMKNIGILSSTDPVALDKACLDLVFNHPNGEGDNNAALVERINSRHGTHTVDHAAAIGLGTMDYELIDVTNLDL